MTKFKSVAVWARSIGSTAKTLKGQKKAIVASFSPQFVGRLITSETAHWANRDHSRAECRAVAQRKRQQAFAATHPLTLSSPPPATRQDVYGNSNGQCGVLELQSQGATVSPWFALVNGWVVTLVEEVSKSYSTYSKSWHNAHGPAITVESRTARIRRVAADGTLETRDQEVPAWRGNYLLNALMTAGVIEGPTKAPATVTLHRAFDAMQVRNLLGLKIWDRSLAGEHVDYCAVRHGVTFHAATVKLAIAGLRGKTVAATTRVDRKGKITWQTGRKLGFCAAGMRNFADDFGLSEDGAYTPEEIEAAIKSHVSRNMSLEELIQPYRAELRTLASAVGFEVEGL